MVTVEIALAAVEGRLGVIDAAAAAAIEASLTGFAPDLDDLTRGTAAAGVPVPALVAQLRRQVGGEAASFVHWGATSQDILDTALVLQLREALALLARRLDAVIAALARLADEHRATPIIGRTRFQQAVPTTFGLKVAGWLAPLLRHRERLAELTPRLLVVQLGGAAGNLVAIGEHGVEVMEALAAELELGCPAMQWHSQRDGFGELASWLTLVTGSLGKLGQDVLLLAQNEVGEVREAEGGGSSTMPQKSNPIRAEALVTLARRNATLVGGMHQAALHAHERDGAAWQLEWGDPAGHGFGHGGGAGPCGRARAHHGRGYRADGGRSCSDAGTAAGGGRELRAGGAPAARGGAEAGQGRLRGGAGDRSRSAGDPGRTGAVPADRLAGSAPAGGASRLRGDVDRSRAGRGARHGSRRALTPISRHLPPPPSPARPACENARSVGCGRR